MPSRGLGSPESRRPNRPSSLIPLCHPIRLDRVAVDVAVDVHRIEISAVTEIVERTGVEMEALTACAVAALTLVKALDPRSTRKHPSRS